MFMLSAGCVFCPVATAPSHSASLSRSSLILGTRVGTPLSPAPAIIGAIGREHLSSRRGIAVMLSLAAEDAGVLSAPDSVLLLDCCMPTARIGQGICHHLYSFARSWRSLALIIMDMGRSEAAVTATITGLSFPPASARRRVGFLIDMRASLFSRVGARGTHTEVTRPKPTRWRRGRGNPHVSALTSRAQGHCKAGNEHFARAHKLLLGGRRPYLFTID